MLLLLYKVQFAEEIIENRYLKIAYVLKDTTKTIHQKTVNFAQKTTKPVQTLLLLLNAEEQTGKPLKKIVNALKDIMKTMNLKTVFNVPNSSLYVLTLLQLLLLPNAKVKTEQNGKKTVLV